MKVLCSTCSKQRAPLYFGIPENTKKQILYKLITIQKSDANIFYDYPISEKINDCMIPGQIDDCLNVVINFKFNEYYVKYHRSSCFIYCYAFSNSVINIHGQCGEVEERPVNEVDSAVRVAPLAVFTPQSGSALSTRFRSLGDGLPQVRVVRAREALQGVGISQVLARGARDATGQEAGEDMVVWYEYERMVSM